MSATGRADAGFTLVELLVVLVLIAGTTAAAVSLFAPRPEGAMVRTARDTLAADLRRQRMAAISSGRTHGVTVYEDGGGYHMLPQGNGIRLPEKLKLITSANTSVVFYPDGSASGGLFRLRASAIELGLKIDPLLGRVSMAEKS